MYKRQGINGPHFKGYRQHPNEFFPDQPYIDTLNVWWNYEDENWWVFFFDGTPNSTFFYARTTNLPFDPLRQQILETDTDAWYSDLEGGNNFELFFDPFIPEVTIAGDLTITDTVYKSFDRSVWDLTIKVEIAGEEYILSPNIGFDNLSPTYYGMAVVQNFDFEYVGEESEFWEYGGDRIELIYGVPTFLGAQRTPQQRGHYEPQWYIYINIEGLLEHATVFRGNLINGNGNPSLPLTDAPYSQVGAPPVNLSIIA